MYQKNPNFKRTQEKNPALRIRDFYSSVSSIKRNKFRPNAPR